MPLQGIAALFVSATWVAVILTVYLFAVRHEKNNDSLRDDDE